MIDRDKLCKDFEDCLGWPYVSPGTNDERGIDCSGMFVRAYRLQGARIYHGSNTIWRKYLSSKGALTSVKQLEKGMAVFKWNASDVKGDGLGDFQHIGLVTQVDPLRIVHASTSGDRVVVADTRLGKWKFWGRLSAVRYPSSGSAAASSASAEAPQTAAVKRPLLRKGARGNDVVTLQNALNAEGYELERDGIFGDMTRMAVLSFQASKGLEKDGLVGSQTWAALIG